MKAFPNLAALLILASSMPSCVSYMESQARKDGLTGDPTQGGFFGFSEDLSNQRIAGMEQERRTAERSYSSKKAEENRLRAELAAADRRLKEAATAEAVAMAERDVKRLRRQILALTSN
jgi:hypothetical protein